MHREEDTTAISPDTQSSHFVLPRIDNSITTKSSGLPRLALSRQRKAKHLSPRPCTLYNLAPYPSALMCRYSHLLPAELVEVLATEARGDKVATEGRDEGHSSHKSQQRAEQIHQQRQRQLREGPHGDPPGAAAPPPTELTSNPAQSQRPRQSVEPLPTRKSIPRQQEQNPTMT